MSVVIDYKSVIHAISAELHLALNDLLNSGEESIINEIKSIKTIEVSDEQNFIRKKNVVLDQGCLYIGVKFGAGSINYGSSVSPVSLMCMGTANKVKPAQILLGHFASFWTTKNLLQGTDNEQSDKIQVWNTPEVVSNFNETNIEFRNLFRVSGNIVFGPQAVRLGTLTYVYDEQLYDETEGLEGFEIINILAFQDGYRASLDSQPFGNTKGFVVSEVNFSTYTFSITTYLLEGHFSSDVLAVRGFRQSIDSDDAPTSEFDANQKMKLLLRFTNGFANHTDEVYYYFKVVDSSIGQELGNLPSLSVTFTR